MNRFTIISGCSGGGKSTVLAELSRRGFATIEEPGRRVVRDQEAKGGSALPWRDLEVFLAEAAEVSRMDLIMANDRAGRTFFDRGLFDALSGLADLRGDRSLLAEAAAPCFDKKVFVTPPWPEIYETDAERKHRLDAALGEYERLLRDYPAMGYEVVELPKVSVTERADFILAALGEA